MSGEWYTALGWTAVIDSLAVLFWLLGEDKTAKVVTSLVVTIAFIHLASPIMSKIDLSMFASEDKKETTALIEIGKGASKWGNHEGVNKALAELGKHDKSVKKDEKGSLEIGKMIVSTIVMMVSLIMAVKGQVFFIGKLRELHQDEEDDYENMKRDEPRNSNVDSSIKDLAKVALRELDHCRQRFGGVSETKLSELLKEQNVIASPSSFSKARNTLSGTGEQLREDGLKLMIGRLKKAKPLP
jgi:hypothetical protein